MPTLFLSGLADQLIPSAMMMELYQVRVGMPYSEKLSMEKKFHEFHSFIPISEISLLESLKARWTVGCV